MDHFPAGDWVDLERGMLPASKAAAMQAHVEQGCPECLNSSQTWRLVVELSSREARNRPAESVVRVAKASFKPEPSLVWLKEVAQFARLIFDSARQPSPAFLRGSRPVSRQLVHEAEPFVIDLRLESEPARKSIFLMGQILNSENPEQRVSNAEVILVAGEKLVKKEAVNDFGEFDMELALDQNLYLFINIGGQRAIGIELPELHS